MGSSWTTRTTILLTLLALGTAASLPWTVHDVFLGGIDGSLSVRAARSLSAGEGYTYLGAPLVHRPPGFPVLLAGVLRIFDLRFYGINMVISHFGILAVVLVFVLYRRRLGDYAACAVGVALWLNPQFQRLGNSVLPDMPGLALLLLTLAIDQWEQRATSRFRRIALGLMVAATTYFDTAFVALLPALLLSRLLRGRPFRAALRGWTTVAVAATLLLAPWGIRDLLRASQVPAEQAWTHAPPAALPGAESGGVDPWIAAVAVACLILAAIRRSGTGDFFALGAVGILAARPTGATHLLLPTYVFALPALVDALLWPLARLRRSSRLALAVAIALVALAVFDSRNGVDWKAQEELHAVRAADAEELGAVVPADATVAASLHAWRDAVYLDRPVVWLLPSYERDGVPGVRRLLDRYGVDTVILRGGTPADLQGEVLRTFSPESLGPHRTVCRRESPGRIPDERLNVLLISIDSLRADHVDGYGAPAGTSPAMDRLAARSHCFSNAIAQAPWTLPSHASLLTSLYPRTHGTDESERALPEDVATLAETLDRAGYDTRAVVSGPFMREEFGLDRGFRHYDDSLARVGHRASHQMVTSRDLNRRAVELLAEARPPFFVFLHYWDVHYDYIPPPPLDERFDPGYAGKITGDHFFMNRAIRAGMPEVDLRQIKALYDGEITWVDTFVGALMDELEVRGLAAHTVVVLTADHGDEFFEHGEKGHQHSLYQELLHVPLLVHVPGLAAGRVHAEPVELVDVMPTVLDIARVPALEGLQGRSLLPAMMGRAFPDRPRFAETREALKKRGGDWKGPSWTVLDGTEKLIVFEADHFPPEVYDLVLDPGEQHPLEAADHARLFEALEQWRARTPEGQGRSLDDLDEETRRTLESLGYAGG